MIALQRFVPAVYARCDEYTSGFLYLGSKLCHSNSDVIILTLLGWRRYAIYSWFFLPDSINPVSFSRFRTAILHII